MRKIKVICEKCNKEFLIDSRTKFRPLCFECMPSRDEDGKINYYRPKCNICGEPFWGKSSGQKICKECLDNLIGLCYNCGEKFLIKRLDKYNKYNMSEAQKQSCKENGAKNLIAYNKSEKGRQKSSEILNTITRPRLDESGWIGSKEQKEYLNKRNTEQSQVDQICEQCGKMFRSPFKNKLCNICGEYSIAVPNFITKDNVRYYKGIGVNELSNKILSGELDINNFPGFNARFGRVHYHTEDIITGDINKLKENKNFIEKDNVLYYRGEAWNYDLKGPFYTTGDSKYTRYKSEELQQWWADNTIYSYLWKT